MSKSSVMKVNKKDEISSVAFFGIDAKQIRVKTTKPKEIKLPNSKKEKVIYDINEAIKEVLIKHGAKHYQFNTFVTCGKDEDGNQLYKEQQQTKLSIPFEIELNGSKGFEMFSCDSWKKNIKTTSYKERF